MRLTNSLREQIIDKCIKATFDEPKENLSKQKTVFAEKVYKNAFGEEPEKIEKMSKFWFQFNDQISIRSDGFGGCRSYSFDSCPSRHLQLAKDRPIPSSYFPDGLLTIDENHALWDESRVVLKTHENLYQSIKQLRQDLSNLLHSVSTVKKLRELWPDGEPFFPKDSVANNLPIPTGLTEKINSMMGL